MENQDMWDYEEANPSMYLQSRVHNINVQLTM